MLRFLATAATAAADAASAKSPVPPPPPPPPPPLTWCQCMDKRPCDRTSEDLDTIFTFLKGQESFRRFHPYLLQQMCYYIFYERLHRGVVLFRQGDIGTCWYTVLSGSLQVTVTNSCDYRSAVPLCILGKGSVFGENTMEDTPRHSTVITNEQCELLVVLLDNFRIMWEKNELFLRDLNLPGQLPPPPPCDDAAAAIAAAALKAGCGSLVTGVADANPAFAPPMQSQAPSQANQQSQPQTPQAGLHQSPAPARRRRQHSRVNSDAEMDRTIGNCSPPSISPSPSPPPLHKASPKAVRTLPGPCGAEGSLSRVPRRRGPSLAHTTQLMCPESPPDRSPDFPPAPVQPKDESLSQPVGVSLQPNGEFVHAGRVLQLFLLNNYPMVLQSRGSGNGPKVINGVALLDCMCDFAQTDNRQLAQGALQVLLEEGALAGYKYSQEIRDSENALYRFHRSVEMEAHDDLMAPEMQRPEVIREIAGLLVRLAPDALFRMILRKEPKQRTSEELEFIYGELLHIKALTHLSTMVKRELSVVLMFEAHPKAGKVLFYQGDEGDSWYIILKGSVDVVIEGKGVVCTLEESDDFGKLALVNDAPRAATIMLREDNCHFLRVAKDDFNRILRDVEANTVRLQEHGKNVIVLEKIPQPRLPNSQPRYQYSVVAGTPEKMLEHLLEARMESMDYYLGAGGAVDSMAPDTMLEDFLLTHPIFMATPQLCARLMEYYQADKLHSAGQDAHNSRATPPGSDGELRDSYLMKKRKVVAFVHWWYQIIRRAFVEDKAVQAFLSELAKQIQIDCGKYMGMREDMDTVQTVLHLCEQDRATAHKQYARGRNTSSCRGKASVFQPRPPLRPSDKTTVKVRTVGVDLG